MNAMAITREAVDFITQELNLSRTLVQIDDPLRYGVDEYLFPSLQAAGSLLGMPGGYTDEGLRRGISAPYITRCIVIINHHYS
jgi:hypothetical protein